MREDRDAMMLVRAELCERLAAIQFRHSKASHRDFVASVSALRHLAATYGMTPVVRLAQALEESVANRPPKRNSTGSAALYLDRLHDAIGCGRVDDQASEAIIASVSVRLSA
jgi:hypothetical protein